MIKQKQKQKRKNSFTTNPNKQTKGKNDKINEKYPLFLKTPFPISVHFCLVWWRTFVTMLNDSSSMLPNTRAWQTTNRQTNKQESIEKPNEVQFRTDYRWTIFISLCENGEVSRCKMKTMSQWVSCFKLTVRPETLSGFQGWIWHNVDWIFHILWCRSKHSRWSRPVCLNCILMIVDIHYICIYVGQTKTYLHVYINCCVE